jgi:hypothetical protein
MLTKGYGSNSKAGVMSRKRIGNQCISHHHPVSGGSRILDPAEDRNAVLQPIAYPFILLTDLSERNLPLHAFHWGSEPAELDGQCSAPRQERKYETMCVIGRVPFEASLNRLFHFKAITHINGRRISVCPGPNIKKPYKINIYRLVETYWQPVTGAARSKAWNVFARLNTGIMGSNPARGMDVCLRLFCVCVVLCR